MLIRYMPQDTVYLFFDHLRVVYNSKITFSIQYEISYKIVDVYTKGVMIIDWSL